MTYPALDIDSIIESTADFEEPAEAEIFEYDFAQRESLSENFNVEIDAWARHSLALNGFGDY